MDTNMTMCAVRQRSEEEEAAEQWAAARRKMSEAREVYEVSKKGIAEAEKEEIEAWNRLERVAGRQQPTKAATDRKY